MEGILRALGFDKQPEYAEKIPDTLTAGHIFVHDTFHHGFPSQPKCLAYDSMQQVLAIGSEDGSILLLGKPGLERYLFHPKNHPITQMTFITNKGLLVTMSDSGELSLWSLSDKFPSVKHTVELSKEKPTTFSHHYGSEWLYVGTDEGNVYLVHTDTFLVATYCVAWNHTCIPGNYRKPGDVIAILEHPMDTGKVLIAYSHGLCVVYDMRVKPEMQRSSKDKDKGDGHKRFSYDPQGHHILTSVCWHGNGKLFCCSYSDGTVVLWNPKVEGKPEKIYHLHESDPGAFKPIYKLQMVHTDGEPWMFCSGGFPEDNPAAPQTLTIHHSRSSSLLSTSSTILDFVCLTTSPFHCDPQDPKALVILTKNELIVHDLQTPGFPRYPSDSLPSVVDLHVPPVTCLHYVANCPDEFVAQLHSVKSKRVSEGRVTKQWPLKGGKWGQEISQTSTDLVVTGHSDGSLRLWNCNSVIFQSFFTVGTSQHFRMQYNPAPKTPQSAPPRARNKTSYLPQRPPPPLLKKRDTTPPSVLHPISETDRDMDEAATEMDQEESQAEGESGSRKPSIDIEIVEGRSPPSTDAEQVLSRKEEESFVVVEAPDGGGGGGVSVRTTSASPAPFSDTGEEEGANSGGSSPSGEQRAAAVTPDPDRKVVFSSSKKKKSKSKGKKQGDETSSKEISSSLTVTKEKERKSPRLSRKSFRKIAKFVRVGRNLSTEEADGEGGASPPTEGGDSTKEQQQQQQQQPMATDQSQDKRPKQITFNKLDHSPSPEIMLTPADSSPASSSSSSSASAMPAPVELGSSGAGIAKSRQTKRQRPAKVTTSAPGSIALHPEDDDFFSIDTIHVCTCGLWLCVSNGGGSAMVFDFEMTKPKTPQTLDINFDFDSIMRQSTPATECPRVGPASGGWVFEGRNQEPIPGFQLSQHCSCFFSCGGGVATKLPATVQAMQYSIDMGLLAVGSNRGFAVVDIRSNTCLHVLSTLTSILYLTDPGKYGKQMRKETAENMATSEDAPGRLPTIRRNATSLAFSVKALETAAAATASAASAKRPGASASASFKSGASRSQSSPQIHQLLQQQLTCVSLDPAMTDWDSGATVIEIVQLQLEKNASPTLTMWVGLASGYVVAYGIKVVPGHSEGGKKATRKIEFFPTRMVVETNKNPVVGLFFLNELGDQQVVPYKRARTLSLCRDNSPEHVGLKRQRTRREQQPTSAPQHYAIIVDEQKIKSYSFPGFNQISKASPSFGDDGVILQSSFFNCSNRPCLTTITSCRHIVVHSLPGLKPLVMIPYSPLLNKRSLFSLRVSGHGQGVYLSSHSELQRICVAKEDLLNLPACLPDVYVPMADCKSSFSERGIVANFFSSSNRTEVDQTKLFTEGPRAPLGNLYKLDGRHGTAFSEKKRAAAASSAASGGRGGGGGGGKGGGGGRKAEGVAGRMNQNRDALMERKEKLSNIERKTADVADHAGEFSSMAAQLAKKYERR